MGLGYHVYLDATGLVISGGDYGFIFAQDGGLVDGSMELAALGDGCLIDGLAETLRTISSIILTEVRSIQAMISGASWIETGFDAA